MATNIIETIQQNLEYPPLRKIDPNIQEAKDKYEQTRVEKLSQAAIPAVLAGIYKLSRKDTGANSIIHLQVNNNAGLLSHIFEENEAMAVQKVAQYGEASESDVRNHMEIVAAEAIRIIRKAVGENGGGDKVKKYLTEQRHNVLVYLPAAMGFGELLNDETMDDRTNKMEGPVSNWIHKIENKFSGSGG
jgi:hypothetical protein